MNVQRLTRCKLFVMFSRLVMFFRFIVLFRLVVFFVFFDLVYFPPEFPDLSGLVTYNELKLILSGLYLFAFSLAFSNLACCLFLFSSLFAWYIDSYFCFFYNSSTALSNNTKSVSSYKSCLSVVYVFMK